MADRGEPDVLDPAARFQLHRRLLFTVAYDILGTVGDAEDVVQDAWLRWTTVDASTVDNTRAYLVRIAANLALTRLRSARNRRETYIGPWLPEPLIEPAGAETDPAGLVERDEAVSMAMLVVLETLSPLERTVFVLREVFGLSHTEVAEAVDRSPASVRQLAHRAREHVQARRPRFAAADAERRQLTEAFLAACASGDLEALRRLLASDVTLTSDGGGRASAARRRIHGADKVGRFALGATRKGMADAVWTQRLVMVNGECGVVSYRSGRPAYVTLLEVVDGVITAIFILGNPDKLSRLDALPE